MSGTFLLVFIALALRLMGAIIRHNHHRRQWIARAVGWVLCTSAAWLIAGVAGAWSPWWLALAIALAGLASETRLEGKKLWPVADIGVILLAGLRSIPPLPLTYIVVTAALAVAAGLAADWTATRIPIRRPLRRLLLLGVLALVGVTLLRPQLVSFAWRSLSNDMQDINGVGSGLGVFPRSQLIHLGITPPHEGERIVLPTGAVARLDRPAGGGPFPGLVFFHGNDPAGSLQPAAAIFRRAAKAAGFVVLAVDHPGYGQSPLPDVRGDIASWDPLPTAVAAVETLHALPEVSDIVVAGHSMGAGDVLRVLAVEPEIEAAVLLGASPIPTVHYSNYWYERFHSSRRMQARLSAEQYVEISEQFYNMPQLVQDLPPDHPPILFVRFEYEWPDIAASRDQLYNGLGGCKLIWDFSDATHYFSTADEAGLVFGDTRPARRLTGQLRQLASLLAETAGAESLCVK